MKKFYFSAIYGHNEGIKRRSLWSHLKDIHSFIKEEPWILAGDFNIFTEASESSNLADSFVANSDIRDFTTCKDQLQSLIMHSLVLILHGQISIQMVLLLRNLTGFSLMIVGCQNLFIQIGRASCRERV